MWHELTEESLANAIDRAHDEHAKVAQVNPGLVSVSCSSGMHPAGHLVEFERRADLSLWARCWVGEGQGCPAELSRRPCWHLAAGVVLFLALEDRDGLVEHAVRFDGPLPARETRAGRFECRRAPRKADPEPDPEAVLVTRAPRPKVERVRGFQI